MVDFPLPDFYLFFLNINLLYFRFTFIIIYRVDDKAWNNLQYLNISKY